jgi:hypothetical protein
MISAAIGAQRSSKGPSISEIPAMQSASTGERLAIIGRIVPRGPRWRLAELDHHRSVEAGTTKLQRA